MSSFTDELTVTKIRIPKQSFWESLQFWKVKSVWKVSRAFRYYVGAEGSGIFVDIPEGFTTDFASIPRIFWPIVPPDGEYTQAAVVHDFLYRTHTACEDTGPNEYKFIPISKKDSDSVFLEAMRVLEVPEWKANTMYKAVDLFGQGAWDNGFKKGE